MGFFDRNRKELAERGIDPDRLPPGQYFTDRFPVLHAGNVPIYKDLTNWDFRVFGSVDSEVTLSYAELMDLEKTTVVTDIHCVTKWSKFDTQWKGISFEEIIRLAKPTSDVTHIMCHSEFGFTANLPIQDVTGEKTALLAYEFANAPLEPEHGYPLRFFVPHLYFWKSAKWLRGIEFMTSDKPGFWESNGYHNYGDPWREQRFWGD
ncbi:MAG: sulfite oxidase-like oxidoreductase [Acidimicrobiaceae bacterium]|nr:sulfite oxidase-like oxidoreductase [Acidimicrobiaceae bacterium]